MYLQEWGEFQNNVWICIHDLDRGAFSDGKNQDDINGCFH